MKTTCKTTCALVLGFFDFVGNLAGFSGNFVGNFLDMSGICGEVHKWFEEGFSFRKRVWIIVHIVHIIPLDGLIVIHRDL